MSTNKNETDVLSCGKCQTPLTLDGDTYVCPKCNEKQSVEEQPKEEMKTKKPDCELQPFKNIEIPEKYRNQQEPEGEAVSTVTHGPEHQQVMNVDIHIVPDLKATRITKVSMTRKFNIGNFETLDLGVEALIGENDTAYQVFSNLKDVIDNYYQSTVGTLQVRLAATQPQVKPKIEAASDYQQKFPIELQKKLSFTEKGGSTIIKPLEFLGSENYKKIVVLVKELGGEYVSAGKDSYFRIPSNTASTSKPSSFQRVNREADPHSQLNEDERALFDRYGFVPVNTEKHSDGIIWHIVKKKDSDETYYRATDVDDENAAENSAYQKLKAKLADDDKAAKFGEKGYIKWLFDNGDVGKKER